MKRTTFRQTAWHAQMQRRARANRVYRYPFHPNEHAQHYIVPRGICGAIADCAVGMGPLRRVGVSFTRWQRWRLRFAMWRGKPGIAQRIILKALEKEHG